jgi:hypothetical protein
MQISIVNRPSTSLKGPVKVPQKEQGGFSIDAAPA